MEKPVIVRGPADWRGSVQVTRSFLPELDDYVARLREVWETGQLTNHGPLVTRLEEQLRHYLDVDHLYAMCNGTVAIQIAIEALELRGEVITTPFSYVATTSSLMWQHCRPVFADIDPETLAIDPAAIEAAITPETTGILATHVYGFPCDIDAIGAIAKKHGLKVIYDAAHCFGVRFRGRGLMRFGDLAISSFHATKVFHCAEGGAVTVSDPELAGRVAYMRNFGHKGREDFYGIGINGKLSELHAAYMAAMAGRPFVLLGSNTHKIEGFAGMLPAGVEICENLEGLLAAVERARDNEDYFKHLPGFLASLRPLPTFAAIDSGVRDVHGEAREIARLNEDIRSRVHLTRKIVNNVIQRRSREFQILANEWRSSEKKLVKESKNRRKLQEQIRFLEDTVQRWNGRPWYRRICRRVRI